MMYMRRCGIIKRTSSYKPQYEKCENSARYRLFTHLLNARSLKSTLQNYLKIGTYWSDFRLANLMNLAERSAKRPILVTIAVTIFSFNAILMLIWWLVLPDEVVSNGSQVFFVLLWLMMAILLYIGAGWVRYASIALVILFAMAWYNTTGTKHRQSWNVDREGYVLDCDCFGVSSNLSSMVSMDFQNGNRRGSSRGNAQESRSLLTSG